MGKPSGNRLAILICLVLALLTLALYWQVLGFDFTNYDDNAYVWANPHVKGLTLENVIWAFTSHRCNNWHPLTWISHMVDVQTSDMDPGAHHLSSMVLHLANVLLLFVVLRRMTGSRWRSAVVAALFAVHPLHVESVAWVAERKDVLSTFFFMLTMLAYVRYVGSPGRGKYALVVLIYALGLMSKPMLVSLPFVLLLVDFWPLGRENHGSTEEGEARKGLDRESRKSRFMFSRFRVFVIEKTPLLALALASCVATFVVQKTSGAVESLDAYPIGVRIANALVASVEYLIKTVWPVKLACFYPHPGASLPLWQTIGSGFLLLAITILAIRAARTRPYLTVGWLWYLVTLAPVVGIVQVGKQAMADRYAYIPLIGIFVAVVWGAEDLVRRRVGPSRVAAALQAVLAICVLSALTAVAYRQVGYWRNDPSIWEHAIAVTRKNAIAHYNLGTTLAVQGDDEGAIRHFTESLRADPRKFDAHANMGVMLLQRGKFDEGIKHLRVSIKLKPDGFLARSNLGLALVMQGKFHEAIPHLRKALELNPTDADTRAALEQAMEHGE